MKMNPFQRYHGSLGSIGTSHIQEMEGVDDLSSAPEEEEGSGMPKHKSDEAAKKHALAEKQRRVRIKRHFDTLRHLFPNLVKTDKASLLTEAVRRVKELKQVVADLVARQDGEQCAGGGSTTGSSLSYFLPSEDDEFTVSYCDGGAEGKTVKVTVCCEDRPGLNRDLTAAVRSVRGTAVRVEMATVGGRTKAVVVVVWRDCGGGGEEDVETLRRALKAVVEDRALRSSGYLGLPSSSWSELGQELPCVGKRARVWGSISDGLSISDGQLLCST